MQWLFDYFQKMKSKSCVSKHFSCDQKICHSCRIFFIGVFSINLSILKEGLLPHVCNQSTDLIPCLPIEYITNWMSPCTSCAIFIMVKRLTMG